tara:strand:- start:229 stop:369 length:141 start_codon:yes stop_codon:yes gene_type:complete
MKSDINNIPRGNVKYIKFKGTSNKLSKATSPIACFRAKSKRLVIPV